MSFADPFTLPSYQLLIIYGVLFIATVLLVEGLLQLVVTHRLGPEGKINRRLRMLESGVDPQEVLQRLTHRKPERGGLLHPVEALEWMIVRAGLPISTRRFMVIMGAIALLATAALALTGISSIVVASVLGSACGIILPLLFLSWTRRRRLRRFAEQLPEALDLIVRGLRAGHPLNAGLGAVATELPDPIGTEFGIVVAETTYGLDLREAIANMGRRIDLLDLHYLSIAIRIQYGTGGNLAEVLENLSKLVRARFQMFRKVRAITAEGRLSAWFLSLFPIALGAVLISIKSDYYAPLRDGYTSLFPWIVGITLALLVVNILAMRWLVNIKI